MKLTKKQRNQLGKFCFSCCAPLDAKSIAGGRCTRCGDMICAASQEELEKEFNGLDQDTKYQILNQIG